MRGNHPKPAPIPIQLTKQTQTVQFPSDGEKTSPSALATPSCRHPVSHGGQRHPSGNSRGGHSGNWGDQEGQDSPMQVGQQPPAGAGSGWEQGTEQLTVSQRTCPPWQDTWWLIPGLDGAMGSVGRTGCSPGRCSSGIPALSSEHQALEGSPGANNDGMVGWRCQGLPWRVRMAQGAGMGRREGIGYQELPQGGGERGSPSGAGGSQEGAGQGWVDAAGIAG